MTAATMHQTNIPEPAVAPRQRSRRGIFVLWLLASIPLQIALGTPAVSRTQEARVLETARQMLGRGIHGWLIPSLNDVIRVRKPPLAYWMAAASFKTLGISEWAGRFPTAILSWLTLAVTYKIASRRFGPRVGLLSSACLLSSFLFFRHGRLAETDAPAMLLTTLAIDLFWQALDEPRWLTFHLAAAVTGLSLFAKQGPGFFAPLFFIVLAMARGQYKPLWRFVLSGAPLTLLIIAGWWYGYAIMDRGVDQFRSELAETTGGLDHPATFLTYFPLLLQAGAPWSLIIMVALVAAVKKMRSDPRIQALVVWAAVAFVPLCFMGNKQIHYLLPLMPPLMILLAWLLEYAGTLQTNDPIFKWTQIMTAVTVIGCIIAPLTLPEASRELRGHTLPLDWTLAIGIAIMSLPAWWILQRAGALAAIAMLAGSWAFLMPVLLGMWAPTIEPADIRHTASQMRNYFAAGPYVFYGGDTSLPLCFALREKIIRFDDNRPDVLLDATRNDPELAVIWEIPTKGAGAQVPPPPFAPAAPDFGAKGQHFRIYQKQN